MSKEMGHLTASPMAHHCQSRLPSDKLGCHGERILLQTIATSLIFDEGKQLTPAVRSWGALRRWGASA